MNNLRVLASEKRQRFLGHLRATDVLPPFHLVRVAQEEGYSVLMRAAALRNLTACAPIEVTKGRPYAERRRLVRAHFGI